MTPDPTWETHAAVCPYCEYENDVTDYHDEGPFDLSCGKCERPLKLTVHLIVKYEVEAV